MKYVARVGESVLFEAASHGNGAIVVNGTSFGASRSSRGIISVVNTDGVIVRCSVGLCDSGEVLVTAENHQVQLVLSRSAVVRAHQILDVFAAHVDVGIQAIHAPMPGMVRQVLVSAGDHVHKGAVLAILEAMKMENEVKSTATGTVISVDVSAGASVDKGKTLCTVQRDL